MEALILMVMIVLGLGLAAGVAVVAGMVSTAEKERAAGARATPDREAMGASILYAIGATSGGPPERILEFIHQQLRLSAPVTRNADLRTWSEAFRRNSTGEQRARLLEDAVKLAVAMNNALPLAQYNALLDLSFGLGFQTDALARLRARYRFEYTDYAKAGRPRSADRAGGATALFDRRAIDGGPYLEVLGLSASATRSDITTAYRRLAAQHHPDRFHQASAAEQEAAAARFIAVTEAYEKLLMITTE